MECTHKASVCPTEMDKQKILTANVHDYTFLLNSYLILKLQNSNEIKTPGEKDQIIVSEQYAK